MSRFFLFVLVGIAALLTVAMFVTAGWDVPPVEATQQGFRGTAMNQFENPREAEALEALNQVPPPPYEIDMSGPKAGGFYENVQVLTDISTGQFNRLMAAITEWVAPEEEGCAYCHNLENMADDSKYTHMVARRMIQMTWEINREWVPHVQQAGVTCYTCHRGMPVPQYIWFKETGPRMAGGLMGDRRGQNTAAQNIGSTSLNYDTLSHYLLRDEEIRVHSEKSVASPQKALTRDAENTYALMIHMSNALGVNCTYCHNSRAFNDWSQSTPQRITAWHGIEMSRSLNVNYLEPLGPVYPDYRLGPTGDAPKVNCTTCHQNINKPLYGVSMVKDYPALAGPAQLDASDEDEMASAAP
ncbi:MAG: photosynthetic reaction center cytochrome PufC [Alphaproteobacteria bacterium]